MSGSAGDSVAEAAERLGSGRDGLAGRRDLLAVPEHRGSAASDQRGDRIRVAVAHAEGCDRSAHRLHTVLARASGIPRTFGYSPECGGRGRAARGAMTSARLDRVPDRDARVAARLDQPVRDEEVHVADHLRQRQVRLGHRDVSPDLPGDLVRRARLLADEPEDLVLAAVVQPEALVDQRAVVGDRIAVAGEDERTSSRPSCAIDAR